MAGVIKTTRGPIEILDQDGPVIFFEVVPQWGHTDGVLEVSPMVYRHRLDDAGGVVRCVERVATLRCTENGANALVASMKEAILSKQTASADPEGPAN
ncbi:MAG: hypothetical protein H0T60_10325 [Acidobacteria bacterium]|nr:hypothetical protein [Acidobacteriota bacterium]